MKVKQNMIDSIDEGMGSPDARRLVNRLTRGTKLESFNALQQVKDNLSTCTDLHLVDSKYSLDEWQKSSRWLFRHLTDWEATAKALAPTWWVIDGFLDSILGMGVITVLQAKEQFRKEKLKEVVSLVEGEISERLTRKPIKGRDI